jgi:Kef-type K+ transport system membrane component KefB
VICDWKIINQKSSITNSARPADMPSADVTALKNLHVEDQLLPVLLQLAVILAVARVAGVVARRLGQPAVVGEVIAGLMLGPSLFGALFPDAFRLLFQPTFPGVDDALTAAAFPKILEVIKELGLVFLLFLIGLEFEADHLRHTGRAVVAVCVVGTVLPFAFGAGLAPLIHGHLEPHPATGRPVPLGGLTLFLGSALTITALPVLGRITSELGIQRTKIAATVIAAAAAGDAVGWVLMAGVAAAARATFSAAAMLAMIGLTVGFVAGVVLVARPLLAGYFRRSVAANGGQLTPAAFAVLLVALLLAAMATSAIGIFAIFGAFTLGAVLSGEAAFREAVMARMQSFVTAFFLPVFFTYTGLRTQIGGLDSTLWLIGGVVIAAAVVGKLVGCGVAARLTGFPAREAVQVGVMMNTRGLIELVVVNVGYQLGVIPPSLYTILVVMAVVTTVMTTPLLLLLRHGTEIEGPITASGFLK